MKYWKILLEYLQWKIKTKFGLKKKKNIWSDIPWILKQKTKNKKQQSGRLKVNISIWPAA